MKNLFCRNMQHATRPAEGGSALVVMLRFRDVDSLYSYSYAHASYKK